MTTDAADLVNVLALIPLIVGGLFAAASAALYGFGSPWWTSRLGAAFLGVILTAIAVAIVPTLRRAFDLYPGYEWVATVCYTYFAVAWIGLFFVILDERRQAPTLPLPLERRSVMSSTSATKSDARERSLRTLLQGLAIDVLVAIGVAVTAVLVTIPDAELVGVAAWVAIGVAVLKSALTAVASYLTRLALPPAGD